MKSIAVLLTVYNRKRQTIICLDELFKQRLPDDCVLEVWLTDDGCTDGTKEEVSRMFPSVHIIHGDGSLFWNRGMWTAWNVSSKNKDYDYYLWLNDDTILFPNSLRKLLEEIEELENRAILVGVCTNNKQETTYGGYINRKRLDPNGNLCKVDYFNGNIVLVPRYVFKRLGNLDYYYRHSHGDTDYGRRASKIGICSYITKEYLGFCDRHENLNNWCDPSIPFKKRWNSLFKPTGYSPKEVFYYEKTHNGVCLAIFHQVTIYLRVLFPWLWIKANHHSKA